MTLGQKIVDELSRNQHLDILARWLCHYLAEQIESVQSTVGEDRERLLVACSDTILRIWAHRRDLPDGARPFEEFDAVWRTLKSLDPEDTFPRYLPESRKRLSETGESKEAEKFLEAATGVDYTARILIRFCIDEAVRQLGTKSEEWLKLSGAIVASEDPDIPAIRVLLVDSKGLPLEPAQDTEKKLTDLLQRLEGFASFAAELAGDIKGQLAMAQSRTEAEERPA